MHLMPVLMYQATQDGDVDGMKSVNLLDCIECGCCAYVCPSHIPLVDYFRFAKSEIWARERDNTAADQARERFEFRNYRQEREKEEKAAKLAAKAAETRAKLATDASAVKAEATTATAEDPKKALIAAALARAQAQKASTEVRNTEDLSAETKADIAEIEARRKALNPTAAPPPALAPKAGEPRPDEAPAVEAEDSPQS